jgi:hypothetical protein
LQNITDTISDELGVFHFDPSLSTDEEWKMTAETRIYPNPFENELHIKGTEGYTLRIFSLSGSLVRTPEVIASDETIDLTYLPAGSYLFRLDKDGKTKAIWGVKK